MSELCSLVPGTDARNQHPVAILWADKIAHLTGTQNFDNDVVTKAYAICHDLARGE